MTITETIKKAVEGGYDSEETFMNDIWNKDANSFFLDPLFWQSLGKSLGWDKKAKKGYIRFCDIKDESGNTQFYWNYIWHRFIDHLAEGKSIESFFKELK